MSEWKRKYRAIPFGKNGEIRVVQQTFSGSDSGLTGDELIIIALADEITELKAYLWSMSKDMHHASLRPCPTCLPISKHLNEPYGCYVVNGEFKPSPPKEQSNG